MESVWIKIISNKGNPLFWPVLLFLMIISWFYRIGSRLINSFRSKPVQTKAAVVSVGNLTVGGTGKTPVTIFLANYYLGKGKKVGVVSSGYGRQIKTDICGSGSDISQKNVAETGDELMEMAECLPEVFFSITKSKTEAALLLEEKYQPDIIIVDDGFQHRGLFRTLDILLIDAGLDLRKESIFPLGRLRENLSAGKRADLIFITKANLAKNNNDFSKWLKAEFSEKPMADLFFINDRLISGNNETELNSISDKSCYFFAGVGNFEGLCSHIRQSLPNLSGWRQFSDHCRYGPTEIAKIKNDLEKYRPEYIITTRKDFTKLRTYNFEKPVYYLKLKLQLDEDTKTVFEKLDQIAGNL